MYQSEYNLSLDLHYTVKKYISNQFAEVFPPASVWSPFLAEHHTFHYSHILVCDKIP